MNTGIQDAHNLAWKFASVIQGIAPVSLLSTYEMERKQIASFNTELSVRNFNAAMVVPAALGIDPSIANAGGTSLQLQFPAEDLGFRYLEGALVSDGDSPLNSAKTPTGRRRDYIPSTEPGSRVPHMNIILLSDQVTISTLDLVSAEKVELLLIIAPLEESYQLARAAFKVAASMEVPLKLCVLWPENSANLDGRSEGAFHPWKNFIDVVEIELFDVVVGSLSDVRDRSYSGEA